jgi:hypothetical protein
MYLKLLRSENYKEKEINGLRVCDFQGYVNREFYSDW